VRLNSINSYTLPLPLPLWDNPAVLADFLSLEN